MSILNKKLCVTMPDGSKYVVPVWVIANDRSEFYADEFGGSQEQSLSEDTEPLFEEDEFEIKDWAANNMNWSDVAEYAVRVPEEKRVVDFQEGWTNGEKEIV